MLKLSTASLSVLKTVPDGGIVLPFLLYTQPSCGPWLEYLGRQIEASETAEITPKNSPHFFCTERTVKRPGTPLMAARIEELTAVGTIDAHQFPAILLPATLW